MAQVFVNTNEVISFRLFVPVIVQYKYFYLLPFYIRQQVILYAVRLV